jgi:hypothetical protein
VHIFNYDQLSWSTQQISADGTDPATLDAILDRDTNVFFALSNSQLYELQMGALTQANGSTLGWEYVDAPAFAQNGAYPSPVMALAQNHIHFLNVGQAAEVAIFVIHYAFMQPNLQTFAPLENGGQGFPSVHGETASIFKGFSEVQQQFAFIPDDGSATYIFDAIVRGLISVGYNGLTPRCQANTTQKIQAPTNRSTVMIAASQQELVQMTTSGEVYWIPINPNNSAANYGATWSQITLPISLPSSHGSVLSANVTTSVSESVTSMHTGTAHPSTTSSSSAIRGGNNSLLLGIFITVLGLCGLCSSL